MTASAGGWRQAVFDIEAAVPVPDPLVRCGGQLLLSRGNVASIAGRSKCGKSTIQAAMIAACLAGVEVVGMAAPRQLRVLLADTEQAPAHLASQCSRVFRLARIERRNVESFVVLALREFTPEQRAALIFDAARELRPDVVFIDGVADLLRDSNDLPESEALVCDLLALSSELRIGVVTVLHTTPGVGKMRGHIGSSLERKCETTLTLERDGMAAEVTVNPGLCRNRPFPSFTFKFNDENGDPEIIAAKSKPQTVYDWIHFVMEPRREYSNSELVAMLANCEKHFKKNAAQYGIREAQKKNLIVKNTNGKYTVKLHPQAEIFDDESEIDSG